MSSALCESDSRESLSASFSPSLSASSLACSAALFRFSTASGEMFSIPSATFSANSLVVLKACSTSAVSCGVGGLSSPITSAFSLALAAARSSASTALLSSPSLVANAFLRASSSASCALPMASLISSPASAIASSAVA